MRDCTLKLMHQAESVDREPNYIIAISNRVLQLVTVMKKLIFVFLIFIPAISFSAGDADVIYVKAEDHGERGWNFHVTVAHEDTGWEDYCNGWDVVTDSGIVLKHNESDLFTRLLYHPHENEQPFTRSESRLKIPEGVQHVIVRAHDLVDGFGGQEVKIILDQNNGENYEIKRH